MPLRRKVLLVFLLTNLLTLIGFSLYGWWEERRSHDRVSTYARLVERRLLDTAVRLLIPRVTQAIDEGVAEVIGRDPGEAGLLLGIHELPIFDEPFFRKLVDRAVLIRLGGRDGQDLLFNVRRRFIFGVDELDLSSARDLVQDSVERNGIVRRGYRLAGPVHLGADPWGGFYLKLFEPQVSAAAGVGPLRPVPYIILIGAPGLVFMFWFLYEFVTRNVLEPVERLGMVAQAVASGDYSPRVEPHGRDDELARVMETVNRMLDLVQDYKLRMEARVREATAEIERKNRELMLGQRLAATGTLASGIAHEINNPLGGMVNALRRLERQDLAPEKRQRYMELLEEGIERIRTIVRQVLSVSPRKVVPAPIDLGAELRKVVDLVAHRARSGDVEVDLDLVDDLPPVLGESNEVAQVFLNLLINAVDACGRGGHVRVSAESADDRVVVEVADDGPGMTPEVAAQAFDCFFTTKRTGEGTGIGLAIVHNLVEAHGGEIRLDTAPGRGCRFEVRLPAHRPGTGT